MEGKTTGGWVEVVVGGGGGWVIGVGVQSIPRWGGQIWGYNWKYMICFKIKLNSLNQEGLYLDQFEFGLHLEAPQTGVFPSKKKLREITKKKSLWFDLSNK